MLNILGKWWGFFYSWLAKRCERGWNAIKADKSIIPVWGY